jgi:hypothetical protein
MINKHHVRDQTNMKALVNYFTVFVWKEINTETAAASAQSVVEIRLPKNKVCLG